MDIEKIFSLMDKAEKSPFTKIEIQTADVQISLEKGARLDAPAAQPVSVQSEAEAAQPKAAKAETEDLLRAPVSGVFYVAKEPGAAPFVTEGQHVCKGDTVCIIEAMKTMNEIRAPKSGVIESVLRQDGQAVSAGDALFAYARGS